MEYYRRENYLKRIRNFYDDGSIIKVITGIRRCGKSYLLRTLFNVSASESSVKDWLPGTSGLSASARSFLYSPAKSFAVFTRHVARSKCWLPHEK